MTCRQLVAAVALALISAMVTLVPSGPAAADPVSAQLRASRLGALDPEALGAFYETAFAFTTVRRIEGKGWLELIMRAKDAPLEAASLVIITRSPDLQMGTLPYLILGVPSLEDGIAAAVAAGGSLHQPPRGEATRYAMIFDPDGNQVELIEMK
ncbi:MAG: VOC family protein [Alphaproteobacteria bacterium]|nr:VOC family protein [Alphaproteobacteria bacterium]